MEFKIFKQHFGAKMTKPTEGKGSQKNITTVERAIDQFFANILTADI